MFPLYLGEENAKYILLDCRETKNWGLKLLNYKWLNMNKEVTYRQTLKRTNTNQIRSLGRY